MANAMSGSFVSRTRKIELDTAGSADRLVARVSPTEIFEPTGSGISTAFTVSGTGYELRGLDGGSIDGVGLEVGRMYDIALSFVSSSISGSTIDLFR